LIAVDTSVVVAAFASWHEGHRAALECLRRGLRLPAHVIAATASRAGAALLSRDRRAAATYDLLGADYELMA
jgi:predicted nucleic acid-binding protein